MSAATTYIEWQHPRSGRIGEPVCQQHERELLGALRTLGIGCLGTKERHGRWCYRCNIQGQLPRDFVPMFVLLPDDEPF